jgi:DNA replication and repair protein RecF
VLYIEKISLRDFRNYEEFVLELDRGISIIVGKNGIGKTNIIEAIELMTLFESFRNPSWDELISWDRQRSSVRIEVAGDERHLSYSLVIKENKREYFLNEKKRSVSDLKGSLPAVLFTPDDLKLVKGAAEQRRNALDSIGTQLSGTYSKLRNDYAKIMKNKNLIFKSDHIDRLVLNSWNEQQVEVGAALLTHRLRLFHMIEHEMVPIYRSMVPHEDIQLTYLPSWERSKDGYDRGSQEELLSYTKEEIQQIYTNELKHRYDDEVLRRYSLVGPHRDDVMVYLNKKEARKFASQGQQRSIALAWKIAEIAVMTQINGQPPILLLDDVMSELDEQRRQTLIDYIGGKAQTIITTTTPQYFDEAFLMNTTVVDFSEEKNRLE